MRGCLDADGVKVAALTALRDRLDPFALARTIDQKLERLYTLANHRQSPPPGAPGDTPLPVVPTKRQPERLRDMRFGKHLTNYDRRRMVTSLNGATFGYILEWLDRGVHPLGSSAPEWPPGLRSPPLRRRRATRGSGRGR